MNHIVGKKLPRVDAYEKVTGKAVYGDDILLKDMLHAANRFTDIPCGKIKKLDISRALEMPGVRAIGLCADVPGEKRIGPIRKDQYPLVEKEVFHFGDILAVVAAETREQALNAADAIVVEYEAVEGVFNPVDALKKDCRLIHPEFKSNEVVHYPLRKGNIEEGFKNSDHVIEREYKTPFHEHAYIEPETVTVAPDPTCRGFKVFGSIQNPFTTRRVVAGYMGVSLNRVNVFGSTLGGSFGGKDDVVNAMACRAALLCHITGKPVRLTNTREDSLRESYKRHPYFMKYKVGFNNDGRLQSMKIEIVADSGAYSSQSFFVTWRSVVQATGPYEIPNVETDIRAAYTNNSYTAAFRGFGSPQVIFAQETLMDEIASICGITPLEIRQINGFRQGSCTASGQLLSEHQVSLSEVIEKSLEKSSYTTRLKEYAEKNQKNGRYRYGIGFSCSYRGCSLGAEGTDATSAIVSVQADGSVYVLAGLNENGQGMRTAFSQIAAEVLGTEYEKVVFVEPQTSTITDGGPTVASRGTLTGGNAVIDAATRVKKTIFDVIAPELGVSALEDTVWEKGVISVKNNEAKKISFDDAALKAYRVGANLSAYGWFNAPEVSWHEETGQGNAYFTYVYGCQVAEIKIDTYTGKLEVIKITAAHDVGKAINETGTLGQIYGGVAQGIGYTVLEDYNIQNGYVKSLNLDEYLLPTIRDVGVIDPIIVENPDKYGPFGAKSIGEPTLELASAAINNALRFATGKSVSEIPMTLERLYLGKNLVKPSRSSEQHLEHKARKHSPRVSTVTTFVPASLTEALQMLAKEKFMLMSGGTDVVIHLRKETSPVKVMSLSHLKELKGIRTEQDKIIIGGCESVTSIINNSEVKEHFPLLVKACSLIGSRQIRNSATLAGNLVNAAPCADSAPPLVIYNASVLLSSASGERRVTVADFITKNYATLIREDEILSAIEIPYAPAGNLCAYYQLGRRNAVNITRLSVSVLMTFSGDRVSECRIVAGSVFDRPLRITEAEARLKGTTLSESDIDALEPILNKIVGDAIGSRWSSEYKMPVFINVCRDAVREIRSIFLSK